MSDTAQEKRRSVLIVEDELTISKILIRLAEDAGFRPHIAQNGEEALKKVRSGEMKYDVYIVDLMMPVMDGRTFVQEIQKIQPDAVIIVESASDDAETIIEIMRLGVYDYVLKPIDHNQFQSTLKKAITEFDRKSAAMQIQQDSGNKLRTELEWLNYKNTRQKLGKGSHERNLIYNLKTTMSQGAGFGSLVTLIDLLERQMSNLETEGDYVKIKKSVLDLMVQNRQICSTILDGLATVSHLLDQPPTMAPIQASDLVAKVPEWVSFMDSYLATKNLRVVMPSIHRNCDLLVDLERVSLAIEELIINAYKYAAKDSEILFFTHYSETYFVLSLKNNIPINDQYGIPEDFKRYITEPFIRLQPPEESVAAIERFSLGLGLTVVSHIAGQHDGHFFIEEVKDHLGKTITRAVLAEIYLPIQNL